MRLKILLINLERGWRGGERQTLLLARELVRLGHRVAVMARAGSVLQEKAAETGLNVWPVHRPYWFHCRRLRGFDIIHAQEARGLQLAVLSRCLHRRPVVYSRRLAKAPKSSVLTRRKYTSIDMVVAESEAVRNQLRGFVDGCRLQVIYGAVDPPRPPDAERLILLRNRFAGRKVIGCIAAMTKEKGHDLVLDCARLLQENHPEAVFLLVGDGPLRTGLEERCQDMELQNIVFEGFRDDVSEYFALFDMLVIPSRSEAFVSVALDAFWSGVPVIASDAGGNPEAVRNGETGELFRSGCAGELARVVARYLDGTAPVRLYVAKAREEVAKRYIVERMANEYVKVYLSLAGQPVGAH